MEKQEGTAMNLKRAIIWILGINILAAGIVLNTKTGLGCAAVSSVNYVASRLFPVSFGTASSILYLIFVGIQIVLLKKITIAIALQIPFSILFGWLTDLYDRALQLEPHTLGAQMIVLLIAISLTALGIHLFLKADIVYNPVEGLTKACAQKMDKEIGQMKNMLDLSMMSVSLLIGLVFSGGIIGIGAGTLISALLCGRMLGSYRKMEQYLTGEAAPIRQKADRT